MNEFPHLQVRRLFRVVNGGTPKSEPENWDGDIPWATPVDLAPVHGGTIEGTARTITDLGLQSGSAAVPSGSLLISNRAPIGYVAQTAMRLAFNQGCKGLVPLCALDVRYFRYQFVALGPDLAARGQGSTFVELSADALAALKVACPPLPVQRAIADYLDAETARIDALIAKKRRMIELLEERFAELVATAVTQGLHPSERLAKGPDWVARAPATWEVWPLGRLVRMVSGGTPNKDTERFWNGEVPWASPKDMKRFRLADTEDHVSNEAVTVAGLKVVPAGTVLVVVRGMILAHSFPVAITTEPMTINQDMKALLPTPRVHPEFLAYLLVGLKSVMLSFVEEAAHGTRKLATEVWSKLPVALPGHPEQRSIVEELECESTYVAKAASRLEHQIGLLTEHRQALITAAVTGVLPVPEAVG